MPEPFETIGLGPVKHWEYADKESFTWSKCPSCGMLCQRIFLPAEVELERIPEEIETVIHRNPDYYFTQYSVELPLDGYDPVAFLEKVAQYYVDLEIKNGKNYWLDVDLKRRVLKSQFPDLSYEKVPEPKATPAIVFVPAEEQKTFKRKVSF